MTREFGLIPAADIVDDFNTQSAPVRISPDFMIPSVGGYVSNKVASASSEPWGAGYGAAMAINGSSDQSWATKGTDQGGTNSGEWLQINFDEALVCGLRLATRFAVDGAVPPFTVTTSDGQSVDHAGVGPNTWFSVPLARSPITWVRLTFTGNVAGNAGWSEILVPTGGWGVDPTNWGYAYWDIAFASPPYTTDGDPGAFFGLMVGGTFHWGVSGNSDNYRLANNAWGPLSSVNGWPASDTRSLSYDLRAYYGQTAYWAIFSTDDRYHRVIHFASGKLTAGNADATAPYEAPPAGGGHGAVGADASLDAAMNALAGTTDDSFATALNVLAGTSGLSAVAAMNALAGTDGLSIDAAANVLAGTDGLSLVAALRVYGAN